MPAWKRGQLGRRGPMKEPSTVDAKELSFVGLAASAVCATAAFPSQGLECRGCMASGRLRSHTRKLPPQSVAQVRTVQACKQPLRNFVQSAASVLAVRPAAATNFTVSVDNQSLARTGQRPLNWDRCFTSRAHLRRWALVPTSLQRF